MADGAAEARAGRHRGAQLHHKARRIGICQGGEGYDDEEVHGARHRTDGDEGGRWMPDGK
eukprot:gene7844-9550_t